MYSDGLYHFGIKGQKWGVRRFQNKDGSLTNAGKKRYDDGSVQSTKKVSKHRLYLEKKYREKGMNEADAAKAAERRIKTERVIAVTAGVTVAACAAYYARNKYLADRCDQVLKKGTAFHNLHSEASARPGEHLYVNYRQNDKHYFRGNFSLGKLHNTGHVYDHVLTAKEDIKIPSLKTRKDTFKELFDNDAEFRKTFKEHSRSFGATNSNQVYKNMWSKMGDKNDPAFNVAKRKYYDALRKKGYEAIVDEWDSKPFVFRSDAPLILLNTSSKSLGEMKISELSAKDIMISQANSKWYAPGRSLLTSINAPHANNFKESASHLKRYAAKNAKNTEYVNKALSGMGKLSTQDLNRLALRRQGAVLADAGRYMSKNKKLKASTAVKLAKGKRIAVDTATGTAIATLPWAALIGASKIPEQQYVEKYIAEHPNTKMSTYKIRQKYRNGTL